jgi:hypothetical protein
VSSFVDTILESAVGAWLFWIVTVVVAEPVLVAESVKQMRIVLALTLRSLPLIVTFVVFGDVEYIPELSWVPSEQFVPPLRTLYVPFSLACQVIVELPAELIVDGLVESIVTVGAIVSFVTVTSSLEPVFGVGVAASVTQTRSVFGPTARSAAAIDVLRLFGEDE